MALADHRGRLARFTVRPGNASENNELAPLLVGIETGELIGDKAYDSNAIRADLASRGITATIPPLRIARRAKRISYDRERYKARHLVENLFCSLKQFRGLATRYCKLASSFTSFVALAGWFIATRRLSTPGRAASQAACP